MPLSPGRNCFCDRTHPPVAVGDQNTVLSNGDTRMIERAENCLHNISGYRTVDW